MKHTRNLSKIEYEQIVNNNLDNVFHSVEGAVISSLDSTLPQSYILSKIGILILAGSGASLCWNLGRLDLLSYREIIEDYTSVEDN